MKSGDTAIEFTSTLIKDDSDESWSLSGADVFFVIRNKDQVYVLEAEVVSAIERKVKYVVDAAEFPTEPGEYKQEWKVVFSDNTELRFPSETFNKFNIRPNLE